ncbi:MAG: threonine--tRNA ligase, partial [Nitrospinota bacterium]|nr:threonine--tRNA ligase [Nitrospinota bacterium]
MAVQSDLKPPNDAIAAKVDGKIVDLDRASASGRPAEFVIANSDEGVEILRHSTAHLMAQAVLELYPGAKLTIGPPIQNGFYYDIDCERPFTPEDLVKIEKRMGENAKKRLPLQREEVGREAALALFGGLGESYKVEMINELPEGETISVYRQGDFVDLCRGPHVPSTGVLRHFKLLSVAGAYWRGDERNKMLQRIYGTAFASKEALKA